MAAASCVQEEKEEKEVQEPSDAIAQGNAEGPESTWLITCSLHTPPHVSRHLYLCLVRRTACLLLITECQAGSQAGLSFTWLPP